MYMNGFYQEHTKISKVTYYRYYGITCTCTHFVNQSVPSSCTVLSTVNFLDFNFANLNKIVKSVKVRKFLAIQ